MTMGKIEEQSQSGDLSKQDWAKWRRDTLVFSLGLFIIYATSIVIKIQEPFYQFDFKDLLPNALVWGAIIKYAIDTAQNLIRKMERGA